MCACVHAKVVADVRAKKEADPEWFDALMQRYVAVAEKGEKALENGDLVALGKLLDENHTLCQVSGGVCIYVCMYG